MMATSRPWILAVALIAAGCEPAPTPVEPKAVVESEQELMQSAREDAALTPAIDEEEEVESGLSAAQRNAVREAESYLEMKGFSRAGLIKQLSSEYGAGYALADATAAVDSLVVDWNEQAAREAASYLEMSGFSCDGLKRQLSSDYGAGFTKAQAAYGASAAGAC